LAPESFTIFVYFGISLRINAANCSSVVGAGSAPWQRRALGCRDRQSLQPARFQLQF